MSEELVPAGKDTPQFRAPQKTTKSKNLAPTETVSDSNIPDGGPGSTTIAEQVVAKIAGQAVREIPGVYNLGTGTARALGVVREAVGAEKSLTQGISVEVGQTQAAIDLTLIVEYPYPLHEVATQVRAAVFAEVAQISGLEVTEVNVNIIDVHIPDFDTADTTKGRLQ